MKILLFTHMSQIADNAAYQYKPSVWILHRDPWLTVEVWSSGTPCREFLHVDDLADACVSLIDHYSGPEIVNIGWVEDVRILELAQMIKDVVGYECEIVFDASKPDGTLRKSLATSRMQSLGWTPSISLIDGLRQTYDWFQRSGSFFRT